MLKTVVNYETTFCPSKKNQDKRGFTSTASSKTGPTAENEVGNDLNCVSRQMV